jgi:WD40 repeat protein
MTCVAVSSGAHRGNPRTLFPLLLLVLTACGCAGGGGQSQPTPPTPDFTLTVNPSSLSLSKGGSGSISLATKALNGFSNQVSVQFTGLPNGVSVIPATIALSPGFPQNVAFFANSNSSAVNATAVVTGTSGSLRHQANLGVTVQLASSKIASLRTKYVRTDAVTEYFLWLNTHWTVFHQPTSRFFVTDPNGNQVLVMDSLTEKKVASIPVPGAFGIDDTPDHSLLYVGTLLGDVYTIDPVAMQVKHRYIASQIGPYGYQSFAPEVLADGRVALLASQGGIPSVDGSPGFAIWNPNDNSIVIYGNGGVFGEPFQSDCAGNIGGFSRSGDRTRVLVGSIDSDTTLCSLDVATGAMIYITAVGTFSTNKITVSPDGNYLALRDGFPGNQVALYNPRNLNLIAQIPVNGDVSSASGIAFSADSKTLYVPTDTIIYAYDVASHQQVGWIPNLVVEPTSGGFEVGPVSGPNLGAADGTGILAGPMEEGFGFVDTSALLTGPVGAQFLNAYLNPPTGPVLGGTQTQVSAPATLNAQSQIFFGLNEAAGLTTIGYYISMITPPGAPGPVDVLAFANDGGIQYIPEGFSYGPTILQVTPDSATIDGGAVGIIYGYGLGPANTTSTAIPSDLKVTIAGKNATIIGYNPNAYNLESPPFLMQSVYYTVPSANSAGPADVTVTNSSGSASSTGALNYLPTATQIPLGGAALVQGIYDPIRDLYYFTDASKIQVFSLASKTWQTPINIPAPPGKSQRLWGISLSPNGSKLAVADAQADVIYLVDPANTASVKTFPFAPPFLSPGIISNPAGVAISDSGIVYLTADVLGLTSFDSFYKLDTNTGTLTDFGIFGPGGPDLYLKTALSSDNARVYFNNDGYVFSIDTATDTQFSASTDPSCCYGDYDLTLSRDQTQLMASAFLYDTDLNGSSILTLNDREIQDFSYVYGAKLSPDGTLLFQPSVSGVDIFDGRLGTLRSRLTLPFNLSPNYDALVEDGKDNVLIAITGATGDGIAVLDLTSISEAPPLTYATAATGEQRYTKSHRPTNARDWSKAIRPKISGSAPSRRVIPHVTTSPLRPTRQ